MAEIAVLRTHIVNYAKTREVYVAYRKAGYSKKFREEHEEEILLHQAAKNAFDEMGVKKLPKVKELQTEYAKLLEEKEKIGFSRYSVCRFRFKAFRVSRSVSSCTVLLWQIADIGELEIIITFSFWNGQSNP